MLHHTITVCKSPCLFHQTFAIIPTIWYSFSSVFLTFDGFSISKKYPKMSSAANLKQVTLETRIGLKESLHFLFIACRGFVVVGFLDFGRMTHLKTVQGMGHQQCGRGNTAAHLRKWQSPGQVSESCQLLFVGKRCFWSCSLLLKLLENLNTKTCPRSAEKTSKVARELFDEKIAWFNREKDWSYHQW